MHRALVATLLVWTVAAGTASAQVFFPGSTIQGDYLRGVGIAAWGMGTYNLNTAQANSINVDTGIRLNEYLAAVAQHSLENYVARRDALAAHNKEMYKADQQRIRESPDEHDLMTGNALDVILQDLLNSNVGESTFRSQQYEVPLPVDVIRKIPFRIPDQADRFSMVRLSPTGKAKWPVALQDDRFTAYRHGYERALDKVLEQAIAGKIQVAAIEAVEAAVDDLSRRLERSHRAQQRSTLPRSQRPSD